MNKKLFQIGCPLSFRLVLISIVITHFGCNVQSYSSPDGYDLDKGEERELGKTLNEISGISYNDNDSSLLAISDSKKKIFEISLKHNKLRDYTKDIIAPDQDIEDIVNMENEVYLLSSKGLIYEVPAHVSDTPSVIKSYNFWSQDQNDFESLYYDASVNGLIMLCKDCAADKGQQRRSAYRFDLSTKQFDTSVFYSISTAEVKKILKKDDAKFDPSAASINPLNKRVYILSSGGNLLVIADTRGKPIEAYTLNPDKHPQAEGIAFATNGDMYISNEGKYGKPTLQIFHYQTTGKKK
jgi:uncharacterized protein YjiK